MKKLINKALDKVCKFKNSSNGLAQTCRVAIAFVAVMTIGILW